jgi:beta-galactosidase
MFYKSNKTKAFKGKCLAIVQSSDKAGEIILKAYGDGLVSSQIVINSKFMW